MKRKSLFAVKKGGIGKRAEKEKTIFNCLNFGNIVQGKKSKVVGASKNGVGWNQCPSGFGTPGSKYAGGCEPPRVGPPFEDLVSLLFGLANKPFLLAFNSIQIIR